MIDINPKAPHHTYIISGDRVSIIDSLIPFIEKDLGVRTKGNPDFFFKEYDSFLVEDARDINTLQQNKTLEATQVFVISVKEMTRQAQNAFLKITEDPSPNTCFFFVLPNQEAILPTLRSRAVIIEHQSGDIKYLDLAKKFLNSNPKKRLDIVLKFHSKDGIDKEDVNKFLSAVEIVLDDEKYLHDVYDVKKKLQATGVSIKTLLEHLAGILPF